MTAVKHHPHPHHPANTQPAAPPVTASYLQGIDVSHWDGTVNWTKVKAAGVAFAFAKATDGLKYVDHTFSTNWAGIKAAGLVRGAYHFGHPNHDAVKQAKHFHKVVQPGAGDLPLVLDLEVNDGKHAKTVWTWAKAFLDEIQSLTGKPAIFYSYGPFWVHDMGNPSDNRSCPLWLASYTHKAKVPAAWTDWTIWQYTAKGKVDGISTHVDRNYFKSSLLDLQKLAYT